MQLSIFTGSPARHIRNIALYIGYSSMKIIMIFILANLIGCSQYSNLIVPEPSRVDILMNTADAYVGLNENEDRTSLRLFMSLDPVNYEWCAAFVNSVLSLANVPGSEAFHNNPLLARSFLKWGEEVDAPKKGDIVVFSRGNEAWQGHVGFYAASYIKDGIEYYVILGGNQDDEVNYSSFKSKTAISIRRWPLSYED